MGPHCIKQEIHEEPSAQIKSVRVETTGIERNRECANTGHQILQETPPHYAFSYDCHTMDAKQVFWGQSDR